MISGKHIAISGSKSETNRLLLLQKLFPEITIENASYSDDSKYMQEGLESNAEIVDIHHAGTAMRFLTAYFAQKNKREVLLTGSERMQERPIHLLVDALRSLGAKIEYEKKEKYPPLRISGRELLKNKVTIQANVSSQYLSALLLIAPGLPNGLELTLEGELTSRPYLEMTLRLLYETGIVYQWNENVITVFPSNENPKKHLRVESDWSSASYYFSFIALSPIGTHITLSTFKKNSLQGDASLVEWYKHFGVETIFYEDETITLTKITTETAAHLQFDLIASPDIAQTIAVTALGLQTPITLTGLHTLKIKETDRLMALKTEMEKFGAEVKITDDRLTLNPPAVFHLEKISIATYQDHRMAMAFAPLSLLTSFEIEQADVVSKSYPDFWEHLKRIGIIYHILG